MEIQGNLRKMRTELKETVQYKLTLNKNEIEVNDLLGKKISLEFQQTINCVKCGRETKKSFAQGFCYPCFTSAPETEECVLRPELCRAHEGVARDMEYAKSHCLIDQHVYLSITSDIKVGVTRHTQIPTRWIDQGAGAAIILATTPNRHTAGLIEVALKQHMADKTNWRNMLKCVVKEEYDLLDEKETVAELLDYEMQQYISDNDEVTEITYPMLEIPQKVTSLNFDKTPSIEGTLTGIKGQYLILDNQYVLNIRKFGGYLVNVNY